MKMPNRFASHAVAASTALAVCLGAGPGRAAGDVDKGKAAFIRQCAICHTIEKDEPSRFGPNLSGIVGRKAGSVDGFAYSRAFKANANWEWSEDALASWIMFPGVMVPGTAMAIFQGVAEKDRDDIVAYLVSKK
jgi:cytochrome c